MTEKEKLFIEKYTSGDSFAQLNKRYGWDDHSMRKWMKKYNIPDNYTGRFSQKYAVCDDYAEIWVKHHGDFVKVLIDIEDVDRCKAVGIWSLTKAGYIINCDTKTYLHRFVMNCPSNLEVDHINHDLLDCRKQNLRIATSSQQKMNTKRRIDNKNGHRGVSKCTDRDKWLVSIAKNKKRVIKRFDKYEDACEFADKILNELHGEYQFQEETLV